MARFNAVLIAAVPAIALALSGCGDRTDSAAKEYTGKVTNVEYYTVTPTEFEEYISLPVVVSPYRQVNLGLTNGGRVARILADKGDRVAAGKVLLETDDVMIKANLDMAKATLDFQTSEFARAQKLFTDGSITQAQFDAAKLALAQAKSSVDMATKTVDDATLEAPFAGTITARNIETGDMLSPGTPAFRLIDTSRVRIQAGLPEQSISQFRTGRKVFLSFDSIPGEVFTGTVSFVGPEANTEVRTFPIEVIVENRSGNLHAGILGNARFLLNTYQDALMIPLNSLIETQTGRVVFVLKEGDVVEQRSIKIFPGDDLRIRVEGLAPGERVIARGQSDLLDGEKVNVSGEYKLAATEGTAE